MEIKKGTGEEISVKMVVKTRCDKGENNGDAVNYGKRGGVRTLPRIYGATTKMGIFRGKSAYKES